MFTTSELVDLGSRLRVGGGTILAGVGIIGMGLALATNYRGIVETMAPGRTEEQVRAWVDAYKVFGVVGLLIGLFVLIFGLWLLITGDAPVG